MMAVLPPNLWWFVQTAEACEDGDPRKARRGNRTFKVYVEEVDE